jgi:PAS domain S-box-containing protein
LAWDKSARRFWQALRHWFRVNTFTPAWLGKRRNHPLMGIIIALLSQLIVLSLKQLLVQVFPTVSLYAPLSLLCIAIIALSWGAGPSIVSTLFGALLFASVVQPSRPSQPNDTAGTAISVAVYLLSGFVFSALASQTERSRRNAQTLAISLGQERARLETILDAMPDAVSLHNAQGQFVWLNRKARQMVGAAPTYQAAEDVTQVYAMRAPSGVPLTPEQLPFTRALKGETTEEMEVRYQGGQDQERPFTISAVPLFDARYQVEGVVVVSHDISLRKHAEREAAKRARELETTAALLEAVIEAITDGVFAYNAEGYLQQVNSAGRAIMKKYTSDDNLALPVQQRIAKNVAYDEQGHILPAEQYPSVRALSGEVLKGATSMDVVVHPVDGDSLQLNISGAPIRDARGEPSGAVIVARDVTERRRLERRPQEALESLVLMAEALVQVVPAPVPGEVAGPAAPDEVAQRLVELTRHVLGCQRVAIAAIEPETERQRPIASIGLNADEEAFWWNEQSKIPFGAGYDPTLVPRLRAGEIVIVNRMEPPYLGHPNPYNLKAMLAAPIRLGERLVGILGLDYGSIAHTFTREELALAGAVSQLGALVLERERLLGERAEALGKMLALQETTARMDEFLSIVSHELRTPVTSIKIGIQLMLRRVTASSFDNCASPEALIELLQDQARNLQRTHLQIQRLTHLLDDLIDISRIRAGKINIQTLTCDLGALVCEVVEETRLTHPDRSITLEKGPSTSVLAQVDPDRIGQVLTNYLTNALKYSPSERPVQVGVKVDGPQARVWVRDQGPGIPSEEQPHIWELFHRVPGIEVKSGSGVGLGLGLHISKTMIEQHHGTVGLESTPGQGSTFWFTLPLASIAPTNA